MPFFTKGEEKVEEIIFGAFPVKGELIRGVVMSGALSIVGE